MGIENTAFEIDPSTRPSSELVAGQDILSGSNNLDGR